MPVEESAMHGLVGASPDGLVMSSSDTSRMIGLVEFKAPVHKLYDKTAGTLEGIPRRCMVQVRVARLCHDARLIVARQALSPCLFPRKLSIGPPYGTVLTGERHDDSSQIQH